MIFAIFLITTTYTILIVSFIVGFHKVKTVKNYNLPPKHTFSIVIPFRNEAENLPQLLASIQQLNYPTLLFEILLVNDASDDGSCEIIENFQQQFPLVNMVLLNNQRTSKSPKKDAINTAIKKSQFNWIVTTDADCIVPASWLKIFNQFIEHKQPVFISAPVKFIQEDSFLFHFQNLNLLGLIGTTIGSFGINKPILCNGANLCYNKVIFNELNGFIGNDNIASGDDIFLLEKMTKKYPKQTLFLKSTSATILTISEKNWNSYSNQQIRWASKATAYKSNFSKSVGLVVLLMNFSIIILPIIAIFTPFYWKLFITVFIQKMIVDFILIQKTGAFLQTKKLLINYLPIAFLHPFFTTFIGLVSLFKDYEWKGRKFNK